ncbi:protein phosphatase 2C domain-containing protein [Deinococcus sp.]|uniref:protein phosphatase 2C domain-containing protein n=1 Tax=Deinococcus sp. TaxID=47478 RepID=UPI0025BC4163|nr:protein phosphatase 2C domain-containing protein [Deinococcus sp.]
MTHPDDQKPPASTEPAPEPVTEPVAEQGEGWTDTRKTLKDLFDHHFDAVGPSASTTPAASPSEPAQLEAARLEPLHPEPASDAQTLDTQLGTLENESLGVSQHEESAVGPVHVGAVQPTEAGLPVEEVAQAVTSATGPATAVQSAADRPSMAGPVAPQPEHTALPSPADRYETGTLEEETYVPTIAPQGPQAGDVVSGYQLNDDLGRGWFTANPVGSGPSVDVYVRREPLWAGLRPHRLLPRTSQSGDLTVLEPVHGLPLTLPLAPAQAREYLTELARLLFALEKQGYAVTDLDPASVQLTADGLKLRLPPRVARIGERPEPVLRDGFTPPEVQAGEAAQSKNGVYLLGALLYGWLTGQPLPPEGPSAITLAGVKQSGMPQLLHSMLAPIAERLTPTELLGTLKTGAATLPVYQVAASTDIGLNPERPVNEDSYGFVWRQIGQHGGGEVVLRAVVCDGMGGMAAGEVASQAAVRGFLNSAQGTLPAQVWEANAAVLADMNGRDGGCTISAVEIRGTALQLGHVGDTRAYLAAGGQVEQLSKDHSYVAAMVASGQMTAEEAQVSPERNKVLRSLGSLRTPQDNYVQTLPEPVNLPVGSRVLLVSDGVWGEVMPPELQEVLLHEPTPQAVADRLITLSLEAGAPDNVTALVIERSR